ncbi:MAG: protein kinase [Actinomycetota bacterium]|nr:protein kinase [Actinomycetota bacterium]
MTTLAGRYRLESEVAHGGMATVWRAHDETLARTVAAKILHPHLSADEVFRERFRIEAVAAAKLSHPNIVAIFDTGEHEGIPFIVMEFLPNGTVADRMRESTLDDWQIAKIGTEVCAALSYAHRAQIIHRDIKPGNILFSETEHAKVADFGIAKAAFAPSSLTDTGAVLGTVRYLAPEQINGDEPDLRADLYSLAVVLYEAVTKRSPFTGDNDLAMATARLTSTPKPPRDIRPDVPRELDAAIMRGLEREPAKRFQDADSFGRALSGLTEDDFDNSTKTFSAVSLTEPVTQSFVKSERRWILPAILVVAIAAGLVALFPSVKKALVPSSPGASAGDAISIVDAGTYDPRPGDGSENDARLRFAYDNNRSTAWRTSSYSNPRMGGLKDGVGIWFDLGEARQVNSIEVQTPTIGWEATVRTSEDSRVWTDPGTTETIDRSSYVFKTSGSHRYWMVWIVSLVETSGQGDARNPYSVGISEVRLTG